MASHPKNSSHDFTKVTSHTSSSKTIKITRQPVQKNFRLGKIRIYKGFQYGTTQAQSKTKKEDKKEKEEKMIQPRDYWEKNRWSWWYKLGLRIFHNKHRYYYVPCRCYPKLKIMVFMCHCSMQHELK